MIREEAKFRVDPKEVRKQNENKPKSFVLIIEEICEEICDNYCMYPILYGDNEERLEERCEECPLNRL